MTYTIEQINRAWIEFSKPIYDDRVIGIDDGIKTATGTIIRNESAIRNESSYLPKYRTDFISFLIQFCEDNKD